MRKRFKEMRKFSILYACVPWKHVRNKATIFINCLYGSLDNFHVIGFCEVCMKQNLNIFRLLLHLAYLKLRLKQLN